MCTILHDVVTTHRRRVVVRRRTAAAKVLTGRLDFAITTQLRLGIVDGCAATAGVRTELFASQLPVTTDIFVAVIDFTLTAGSAVTVPLSLDDVAWTADVGVLVVQPPAAAARRIAITQRYQSFTAEFD